MFNRALAHAFGLKKFFCLFIVLYFSGLVFLFFQGLALYSALWLKLPLQFLPLFVAIGLVMAGGIFLVRVYHEELDGGQPCISEIGRRSWDLLIKASFLAFPLIAAFLIFWLLIGIFLLLKSIPYIGHLLGVILAFAPFLLNFAILLLFLTALAAFFFLAPPLAKAEKFDRSGFAKRLRNDFFLNIVLLVVAFLPVWFIWILVKSAVLMTIHLYSFSDSQLERLLQGIFILLPLTAILTPAVTFFFNFAYESFLALSAPHEHS